MEQSIFRNNYSNNNKYDNQTSNNNKNSSEDGDTDELDNSQHLDDLISDKTVDHVDQVILTKESYNSTSVSMNGLTNINTSLPSFFTVSVRITRFISTVSTQVQNYYNVSTLSL